MRCSRTYTSGLRPAVLIGRLTSYGRIPALLDIPLGLVVNFKVLKLTDSVSRLIQRRSQSKVREENRDLALRFLCALLFKTILRHAPGPPEMPKFVLSHAYVATP